MSAGFKVSTKGDIKRFMTEEGKRARAGATAGMRLTVKDLKADLRRGVMSAGLGPKVAKSIQEYVYPRTGVSLNPAGTVVSKAPGILRGFSEGSLIRPKSGGLFLALPTKDTPYGRGGRHITMPEAVKRFGDPAIVRRGRNRLVFFTVSDSKDKLNYRKATKGRAKRGRKPKAVLLFVLVPQVKLPQKIDAAGALGRAAANLKTNIAAAWPQD